MIAALHAIFAVGIVAGFLMTGVWPVLLPLIPVFISAGFNGRSRRNRKAHRELVNEIRALRTETPGAAAPAAVAAPRSTFGNVMVIIVLFFLGFMAFGVLGG